MSTVNYDALRSVDVHGDGGPDTASSTEKCVRHVHLHAPYLWYIFAFLLFDLATANLEKIVELKPQSLSKPSFSEAAGQRHHASCIIPSLLRLSFVSFNPHSFNSRMSVLPRGAFLRPVLRPTSTLFPLLTHGSARRTLITLKENLVRSTTSPKPKDMNFLLSFIDPFFLFFFFANLVQGDRHLQRWTRRHNIVYTHRRRDGPSQPQTRRSQSARRERRQWAQPRSIPRRRLLW